jgi:hypothetical protein
MSLNLDRPLDKHMKHRKRGEIRIVLGWKGNLNFLSFVVSRLHNPSAFLLLSSTLMKHKVLLLSYYVGFVGTLLHCHLFTFILLNY